MTYLVVKVILIGGLLFSFTSCDNKTTANNKKALNRLDTTKTKADRAKSNAFEGLRAMAMTATPERLGLSLPIDKTVVYGTIMDWGLDSEVATVVAYQTGDASLYVSSGGSIIGGGEYQHVKDVAKKFVSLAQSFLSKTIKTGTTPLPKKGVVKFYLLTNKGVYVGQEELNNFDNNSSAWLSLFEEGNKVLSELRLISEK